jgi:hypothetical protein
MTLFHSPYIDMPCKWHVQFRMLFIGCCTPPSFTTSSPPPWSNVLYKTGGSSGIYSPTRLPIQTQSDTHRQTCISCPTAVHQYLVIIRLPLITTSYLVHATIPYLPTVPFGGRLGTIVNFLYPTFIISLHRSTDPKKHPIPKFGLTLIYRYKNYCWLYRSLRLFKPWFVQERIFLNIFKMFVSSSLVPNREPFNEI